MDTQELAELRQHHPWTKSVLYLSMALVALTVATYIVVTTRLVYQQGYQIVSLHIEMERVKTELSTYRTGAEARLNEVETVMFVQVPGLNKMASQATRGGGVVQSWQRNAFLGLERRIETLERWRYSCKCGLDAPVRIGGQCP